MRCGKHGWAFWGVGLLTAAVFVGCGGGTVTISSVHKDGLRPAESTVQEILSASEARLVALLDELHGPRGDNLDWRGFWEGLRISPGAKRLVTTHSDRVLSLQSRDCSLGSFHAYARFLLGQGEGLAYLMGAKRTCLTPLSAPLAVQTFRKFVDARHDVTWSLADSRKVTRFLRREMDRDPSGDWTAVFSSADVGDLKGACRSLARNAEWDDLLGLMVAFQITTGELPFVDLLEEEFFSDPRFPELFLKSQTKEMLASIVDQIAAARPGPVSEKEVESLTHALFEDDFAWARGNAQRAWSQYAKLRHIAGSLSRSWPIGRRLVLVERLQRRMEDWLRALPSAEVERFLADTLTQTFSLSLHLDLRWLVRRTSAPSAPVFARAAREASPEVIPDDVDKVIAARLSAHFATGDEARHRAFLAFCETLQEAGSGWRTPSLEDLRDGLEAGLPPGCYRIESNDPLFLESKQPLVASFDSALDVRASALEIAAPEVALGLVDMSAEKRPAPLPLVATPAYFDAVAFPLMLAVHVPQSSREVTKGTYFLALHYRAKEADPGPADLTVPRAGFPGGELVLRTPRPPRPFAFASFGGLGQAGAPRRAGGKGDVSSIDVPTMQAWVDELDGLDHNPTLSKPYLFLERPTAMFLFSILHRAERDAQGKIRVIFFKEYLKLMDRPARAKLAAFCHSVTDDEAQRCVEEQLAPRALGIVYSRLEAEKAAGLLDAGTILKEVNPYGDDKVPPGALGPVNPEGPRGKTGSVRIVSGAKND